MGMKTRRSSRASIMDLPELIIEEILLHLSIKGIVMCKSVCKTWHHLISCPHFAMLHFAHAKACILVRPSDVGRISRMLYFIEPSEINVIESGHEVYIKLDTKLKIPLHNVDAQVSAFCEGNTKRKRTIELDPKNHKIIIVNSCNGFLCLSQPPHNNPTIVCNPVTNEYIELPAASNADQSMVDCGFGFCQETNQYKVLRVLNPGKNQHANRVVEIHTLGTKSWRSIGFSPSFRYITSPTYLNGVLHWISGGCRGTDLVLSFEFSSECFSSLPQPPISRLSRICMGIIGDCLCLSATSGGDLIDIWVIKSCGVQKSWSKLISIKIPTPGGWKSLYLQLISSCEKFLIFLENNIIYYDPKREELKTFRLHRMGFISEAVVHTPSFISLKDVVTGANIKSISTGFKVPGDAMSIYLRENRMDGLTFVTQWFEE
ncbi:F-box protein [Forsythia ovata]|uniref:F-box protein n=1 Tax=Forsythia ovata TaxID=205694 RepID=A0ABD1QR47_9LAMI